MICLKCSPAGRACPRTSAASPAALIATHLLQSGMSLEYVRDFLGHYHLETHPTVRPSCETTDSFMNSSRLPERAVYAWHGKALFTGDRAVPDDCPEAATAVYKDILSYIGARRARYHNASTLLTGYCAASKPITGIYAPAGSGRTIRPHPFR